MGWGASYNVGSLAMGSFIIAVVTIIRIIVERAAAAAEESDSSIGKCVACCVVCCARCCEDLITAMVEQAYIQVALSSESFCTSGYKALYLQLRNAGRFTAANMVDFMLSVLGKGAIMGLSAFLTYTIVKSQYPRVFNPWIPTMVIAVVSYIIASIFLSLFSVSALAILHSFVVSEESGNTRATPKVLQEFLEHSATETAARKYVVEEDGTGANDAKPANMD